MFGEKIRHDRIRCILDVIIEGVEGGTVVVGWGD